MSPVLVIHICAGCLGIVSGFAAVTMRKGERLHRVFGTVFVLTMLITSALAVYLGLFEPPTGPGAAPPSASASVGILTFYLAATGWMTVRRKAVGIGAFEYGALVLALAVAAALVVFGLHSASIPNERLQGFPARYYIFAAFAAFGAALDLKVVLRGGISGAPRIARHLWRLCFALFFAAAFFFLGQQRIFPAPLRGSPILLAPALAPLALMMFWMTRVRLTGWFRRLPPASQTG